MDAFGARGGVESSQSRTPPPVDFAELFAHLKNNPALAAELAASLRRVSSDTGLVLGGTRLGSGSQGGNHQPNKKKKKKREKEKKKKAKHGKDGDSDGKKDKKKRKKKKDKKEKKKKNKDRNKEGADARGGNVVASHGQRNATERIASDRKSHGSMLQQEVYGDRQDASAHEERDEPRRKRPKLARKRKPSEKRTHPRSVDTMLDRQQPPQQVPHQERRSPLHASDLDDRVDGDENDSDVFVNPVGGPTRITHPRSNAWLRPRAPVATHTRSSTAHQLVDPEQQQNAPTVFTCSTGASFAVVTEVEAKSGTLQLKQGHRHPPSDVTREKLREPPELALGAVVFVDAFEDLVRKRVEALGKSYIVSRRDKRVIEFGCPCVRRGKQACEQCGSTCTFRAAGAVQDNCPTSRYDADPGCLLSADGKPIVVIYHLAPHTCPAGCGDRKKSVSRHKLKLSSVIGMPNRATMRGQIKTLQQNQILQGAVKVASRSTAHRAIHDMLNVKVHEFVRQYHYLEAALGKFQRNDPDGTFDLEFDRVTYCPSPNEDDGIPDGSDLFSNAKEYRRLRWWYACPSPSKHFMKNYKKGVVVVDGTFLTGVMGGAQLVACALDANNQVFPLATAQVVSESGATWAYFVRQLHRDFGANITIIMSDGHAGMLRLDKLRMNFLQHLGPSETQQVNDAAEFDDEDLESFTITRQRFSFTRCAWHKSRNLNIQEKNSKIAYWKIVKATTQGEYDRSLTKLEGLAYGAASEIARDPDFKRMISTVGTLPNIPRYGITTSNSVEQANFAFKTFRSMPPIDLLQSFILYQQHLVSMRKNNVTKLLSEGDHRVKAVTPNVLKKLENSVAPSPPEVTALDWDPATPRCVKGTVSVFDRTYNVSINMDDKVNDATIIDCDCKRSLDSGIPCIHAVELLERAVRVHHQGHLSSHLCDFFADAHHLTTYKEQYSARLPATRIYLVRDDYKRLMPPKIVGRRAKAKGRKKASRVPGKTFCLGCGERGHNHRRCPYPCSLRIALLCKQNTSAPPNLHPEEHFDTSISSGQGLATLRRHEATTGDADLEIIPEFEEDGLHPVTEDSPSPDGDELNEVNEEAWSGTASSDGDESDEDLHAIERREIYNSDTDESQQQHTRTERYQTVQKRSHLSTGRRKHSRRGMYDDDDGEDNDDDNDVDDDVDDVDSDDDDNGYEQGSLEFGDEEPDSLDELIEENRREALEVFRRREAATRRIETRSRSSKKHHDATHMHLRRSQRSSHVSNTSTKQWS